MTWPSHDLTPQQTSRHQNTSLQSTKHHHHGTAEGSFTAKKWFGHRAGRSPCAHSIGKFFLCYIVLFLLETSAPGLSGHYWFTYIKQLSTAVCLPIYTHFSWCKYIQTLDTYMQISRYHFSTCTYNHSGTCISQNCTNSTASLHSLLRHHIGRDSSSDSQGPNPQRECKVILPQVVQMYPWFKTEDFATNVHDTLIHVTSKCSSVPSRWMHGQTLEFLAVQDMRIALRVPAVSHWEKLWFVEASGKISQSPQRALHWSCGSVCKLFPT